MFLCVLENENRKHRIKDTCIVRKELACIALPKNNAMADGKNYGIQSPRVVNGVTTWDKIKFGSYNQEGTFRAEPIKWRVLSVDGDDALLLADQCLDARAYHDEKDEKSHGKTAHCVSG